MSLIPDLHLCVVHAEQVVGLVPEAPGPRPPPALVPVAGPGAEDDLL